MKTRFIPLLLYAYAVAVRAQDPATLVRQAKGLQQAGDVPGALAIYEKVLSMAPGSAEVLDSVGFLLAATNRQDEAVARFQQAIAVSPTFGLAHYHLGVLYWLRKDAEHGLSELEIASHLDPANAEYRFRLGAAYNGVGRFPEAAKVLTPLAIPQALNPAFWTELGIARQHSSDMEGAFKAFSRTVDLQPNSADSHNNLGIVLVNTRRADQAIREFQKAVDLDPQNVMAQVNIGFAYMQKADLNRAAVHFRKLLSEHPDLAIAHYDLGVTLKEKDDLEGAQLELRKALQIDSRLSEAHYTLGIIAWQTGEFSDAANELEQAIEIRPEYSEAYFMLGTVQKQDGKLPAAVRSLREAIRYDPEGFGPYNTLGQVLRQLGDFDGSKLAFSEGAKRKAAKEVQIGSMMTRGREK